MKKKIIIILTIISLFLAIVFNQFIKSFIFMYFYSYYHEQNSIMNRRDFEIFIPGGIATNKKDWYPMVMTFNDDNFAIEQGEDIKLSIIYNFGAFEGERSSFYHEKSDYFSSFYGAYIIETNNNEPYGYDNGRIITDDISKLSKYDISTLVLNSIGCPYDDIEFEINNIEENIEYLNYNDWIKIDAKVNSRSPMHKYYRKYSAYIQYGKPPRDYLGEDYKKINLVGRMYCRYFEEYKSTILLYIIAPEEEIINDTDIELLSKTKIK